MTKKKLFTTILALTMLTSIAVPVHAAEAATTTEQATTSEAETTVSKSAIPATFTGTAKNPKTGKLCYYTNGKVDKKYNSIAKYKKTWYKFKKGVVDKKYTGVAKRIENGKYYYIKKGKLDKKYTGVAKYPKNKKWYRIKKGRVDFKYTGIAKRPETGKWYYIKKGKWVKSYTGIAKYPKTGKSYYVKKGIVDFNYSGTVKDKATGKKYTVKKGKATAKKKTTSSETTTSTDASKVGEYWVRSADGTMKKVQKSGYFDATEGYAMLNSYEKKLKGTPTKRNKTVEEEVRKLVKKYAETGALDPPEDWAYTAVYRDGALKRSGNLIFMASCGGKLSGDNAKSAVKQMCEFDEYEVLLGPGGYDDETLEWMGISKNPDRVCGIAGYYSKKTNKYAWIVAFYPKDFVGLSKKTIQYS